jgi:hypothetical protein
MKKVLVLTALISSLAIADDIKELKYNTGYAGGNLDDSRLQYSQYINELSGKISLDDEWKGLTFNFDATKRNFYDTHGDKGGDTWDTDFNVAKTQMFGNSPIEWTLGFKYGNSDNLKIGYLDGLIPLRQLNGHGHEFYFGPTVVFKIFGQQAAFTQRIVYYNDSDSYTRDYKDPGTEGIGGDFDISVGGPIAEGKFGGLTYGIQLNNHLRKATSAKETTSDEKNSLYLNYIMLLTYSSPRFYGFGFDLNILDQWEKFTGDKQRNNGFYVSPKLLYSHTFDTGIGKFTVNPYVSYNVVDEQHRQIKYENKFFDYSGNKELTGGIQFSLNRD